MADQNFAQLPVELQELLEDYENHVQSNPSEDFEQKIRDVEEWLKEGVDDNATSVLPSNVNFSSSGVDGNVVLPNCGNLGDCHNDFTASAHVTGDKEDGNTDSVSHNAQFSEFGEGRSGEHLKPSINSSSSPSYNVLSSLSVENPANVDSYAHDSPDSGFHGDRGRDFDVCVDSVSKTKMIRTATRIGQDVRWKEHLPQCLDQQQKNDNNGCTIIERNQDVNNCASIYQAMMTVYDDGPHEFTQPGNDVTMLDLDTHTVTPSVPGMANQHSHSAIKSAPGMLWTVNSGAEGRLQEKRQGPGLDIAMGMEGCELNFELLDIDDERLLDQISREITIDIDDRLQRQERSEKSQKMNASDVSCNASNSRDDVASESVLKRDSRDGDHSNKAVTVNSADGTFSFHKHVLKSKSVCEIVTQDLRMLSLTDVSEKVLNMAPDFVLNTCRELEITVYECVGRPLQMMKELNLVRDDVTSCHLISKKDAKPLCKILLGYSRKEVTPNARSDVKPCRLVIGNAVLVGVVSNGVQYVTLTEMRSKLMRNRTQKSLLKWCNQLGLRYYKCSSEEKKALCGKFTPSYLTMIAYQDAGVLYHTYVGKMRKRYFTMQQKHQLSKQGRRDRGRIPTPDVVSRNEGVDSMIPVPVSTSRQAAVKANSLSDVKPSLASGTRLKSKSPKLPSSGKRSSNSKSIGRPCSKVVELKARSTKRAGGKSVKVKQETPKKAGGKSTNAKQGTSKRASANSVTNKPSTKAAAARRCNAKSPPSKRPSSKSVKSSADPSRKSSSTQASSRGAMSKTAPSKNQCRKQANVQRGSETRGKRNQTRKQQNSNKTKQGTHNLGMKNKKTTPSPNRRQSMKRPFDDSITSICEGTPLDDPESYGCVWISFGERDSETEYSPVASKKGKIQTPEESDPLISKTNSETWHGDAEDDSETLQDGAEDGAETLQGDAEDDSETLQDGAEDGAETLQGDAEDGAETLQGDAEDGAETLQGDAEDCPASDCEPENTADSPRFRENVFFKFAWTGDSEKGLDSPLSPYISPEKQPRNLPYADQLLWEDLQLSSSDSEDDEEEFQIDGRLDVSGTDGIDISETDNYQDPAEINRDFPSEQEYSGGDKERTQGSSSHGNSQYDGDTLPVLTCQDIQLLDKAGPNVSEGIRDQPPVPTPADVLLSDEELQSRSSASHRGCADENLQECRSSEEEQVSTRCQGNDATLNFARECQETGEMIDCSSGNAELKERQDVGILSDVCDDDDFYSCSEEDDGERCDKGDQRVAVDERLLSDENGVILCLDSEECRGAAGPDEDDARDNAACHREENFDKNIFLANLGLEAKCIHRDGELIEKTDTIGSGESKDSISLGVTEECDGEKTGQRSIVENESSHQRMTPNPEPRQDKEPGCCDSGQSNESDDGKHNEDETRPGYNHIETENRVGHHECDVSDYEAKQILLPSDDAVVMQSETDLLEESGAIFSTEESNPRETTAETSGGNESVFHFAAQCPNTGDQLTYTRGVAEESENSDVDLLVAMDHCENYLCKSSGEETEQHADDRRQDMQDLSQLCGDDQPMDATLVNNPSEMSQRDQSENCEMDCSHDGNGLMEQEGNLGFSEPNMAEHQIPDNCETYSQGSEAERIDYFFCLLFATEHRENNSAEVFHGLKNDGYDEEYCDSNKREFPENGALCGGAYPDFRERVVPGCTEYETDASLKSCSGYNGLESAACDMTEETDETQKAAASSNEVPDTSTDIDTAAYTSLDDKIPVPLLYMLADVCEYVSERDGVPGDLNSDSFAPENPGVYTPQGDTSETCSVPVDAIPARDTAQQQEYTSIKRAKIPGGATPEKETGWAYRLLQDSIPKRKCTRGKRMPRGAELKCDTARSTSQDDMSSRIDSIPGGATPEKETVTTQNLPQDAIPERKGSRVEHLPGGATPDNQAARCVPGGATPRCQVSKMHSVSGYGTPQCKVKLECSTPLKVFHGYLNSHHTDGWLHMHLFKGKDAPCIMCCKCQRFFAIDAFSLHTHGAGAGLRNLGKGPELKLRNAKTSRQGKVEWKDFLRKRRMYDCQVLVSRSSDPGYFHSSPNVATKERKKRRRRDRMANPEDDQERQSRNKRHTDSEDKNRVSTVTEFEPNIEKPRKVKMAQKRKMGSRNELVGDESEKATQKRTKQRKRGRPAKDLEDDVTKMGGGEDTGKEGNLTVTRKRRSPRKTDQQKDVVAEGSCAVDADVVIPPKRKRGRPKKMCTSNVAGSLREESRAVSKTPQMKNLKTRWSPRIRTSQSSARAVLDNSRSCRSHLVAGSLGDESRDVSKKSSPRKIRMKARWSPRINTSLSSAGGMFDNADRTNNSSDGNSRSSQSRLVAGSLEERSRAVSKTPQKIKMKNLKTRRSPRIRTTQSSARAALDNADRINNTADGVIKSSTCNSRSCQSRSVAGGLEEESRAVSKKSSPRKIQMKARSSPRINTSLSSAGGMCDNADQRVKSSTCKSRSCKSRLVAGGLDEGSRAVSRKSSTQKRKTKTRWSPRIHTSRSSARGMLDTDNARSDICRGGSRRNYRRRLFQEDAAESRLQPKVVLERRLKVDPNNNYVSDEAIQKSDNGEVIADVNHGRQEFGNEDRGEQKVGETRDTSLVGVKTAVKTAEKLVASSPVGVHTVVKTAEKLVANCRVGVRKVVETPKKLMDTLFEVFHSEHCEKTSEEDVVDRADCTVTSQDDQRQVSAENNYAVNCLSDETKTNDKMGVVECSANPSN